MRIPKDSPKVAVADLQQQAKGIPVAELANSGLAQKIDQAGTPDGLVTPEEVDRYRQDLMARGNQTAAIQAPTPEDIASMQALFSEMQQLNGLGTDVLVRTQTADLWATLGERIDQVVAQRSTGKRLGDGDGSISIRELQAYITEMETRIAAPTQDDDVEQLRQLISIARDLADRLAGL